MQVYDRRGPAAHHRESAVWLASFLLLCITLPKATETEQMWRFDMGPAEGPVWPGFTRVTESALYSDEQGYGWAQRPANSVFARTGDGKPKPDALCADWVGSGRFTGGESPRYDLGGSIEFCLDLPNGEYAVWLVTGDYDGGGVLSDRALGKVICPYTISAEGQEKVKVEFGREEAVGNWYYRHLNDEFRAAQDIWGKYVRPRFQEHSFLVGVTDGQLNLVFSNMPVNALVVYPQPAAARAQELLAELAEQRRAAFPFRRRMPPDIGRDPLFVSAEERQRGYILWLPHYCDDIYPEQPPPRTKVGGCITLAAAQGEREPAVFAIYPLRELHDCRVQATDLHGPGGATIGGEHIDVCLLRYYEMIRGHTYYEVVPWFLLHRPSMDMETGVNRAYWLTISVPEQARPGLYRGEVIFTPAKAPPVRLAVRLQVWPFALRPLTGRHYYLQYHYFTYPPARDEQAVRRRYESMADHGFDVEVMELCRWEGRIEISEDGAVTVDLSDHDRRLREWREKYGWEPTIVVSMETGLRQVYERLGESMPDMRRTRAPISFSKRFDELYAGVVSGVVKEIKPRDWWPEVLFLPVTNEGGGSRACAEATKHIYALANQAGAATYSVFTQLLASEACPQVHVPGLTDGFCTERTIESVRRLQKHTSRLWGYYIGEDRFERGFFYWKLGLECSVVEGGMVLYGDPYDEFDGDHRTWAHVWPSPEGLVPTVWWERAGEGVDDCRYLNHLAELIREANESPKPAARRTAADAERLMSDVMAKIAPNIDYYRVRGGKWTGSFMDELRWRLAEAIAALEEELT